MALIKFDKKGFIESLEPGVVAYIVQQFENRLEDKLNKVLAETYTELKKELPNDIKVMIHHALDPVMDERRINVEVDLRASIATRL